MKSFGFDPLLPLDGLKLRGRMKKLAAQLYVIPAVLGPKRLMFIAQHAYANFLGQGGWVTWLSCGKPQKPTVMMVTIMIALAISARNDQGMFVLSALIGTSLFA